MKVKLSNVRLAFPNLFEAKQIQDSDAKFSAAFIFGQDHGAVTALKKAMQTVAKEKWGEKAPAVYKQLQAQDRLALHDGVTKSQYEGYDGRMFINATNSLRPTVLDRDKTPLVATDGRLYAGCFVNAVVELWAMDNKFGKRVNASLMGVQFFADGDRLAGGAVASEDDFEPIDLPGDEDDIFGGEVGEADDDDDDIPF